MDLTAVSFRLAITILASTAVTPTARAADIGRGISSAEVVIEGKIDTGDCSKLGNFLSSEGAKRVYLASPGGSLFEALEIGRLVRALKLETMIPGKLAGELREKRALQHRLKDHRENFTCISACFFVYAAGVARSRDIGDPILGIHRPYLSDGDLKGLSGDQAIMAVRGLRAVVDRYLREMSVPVKYSERMFSVPTGQVQWIGNDDFAADLEGIVPELRDWVAAQGRTLLDKLQNQDTAGMSKEDKVFLEAQIKQLSDPVTRELEVLSRLSGDAWKSMFAGPNADERRRAFCTQPN